MPDEDLGKLVLTSYIQHWLANHDLSATDNHADLADQVLAEIAEGVVSNILYLPLDAALKAAASGQVARAGNLAKQHFLERELDSLFLKIMAYTKDQRLKGPIKGTQVSAAKRRAEKIQRDKWICGEAEKLRANRTPPRNIAGVLAKRDNMPGERQIRNILNECKEKQ